MAKQASSGAQSDRLSCQTRLICGSKKLFAFCAATAARRITKLRGMAPVSRRCNPQDLQHRLDPEGVAIRIEKVLRDFKRRSSSVCAKNALGNVRIALARRSPLTSRSSALRRSRSDVVTPSRSPPSTSFCLTHLKQGLARAAGPRGRWIDRCPASRIFFAMLSHHSDCSLPDFSRKSIRLVHGSISQELEPSSNPGRLSFLHLLMPARIETAVVVVIRVAAAPFVPVLAPSCCGDPVNGKH
jgi:hypothetical protein